MSDILDRLQAALADAVRSRCPDLGPDSVLLLATIGRPVDLDEPAPAAVTRQREGDFVDCLPQPGSGGFVPDTDLFSSRYAGLVDVATRRPGLPDDVGAVVDAQLADARRRVDLGSVPRLEVPLPFWDTVQDPPRWFAEDGDHWQLVRVSETDAAPAPAPDPAPPLPPRPRWEFRVPQDSAERRSCWDRLGIAALDRPAVGALEVASVRTRLPLAEAVADGPSSSVASAVPLQRAMLLDHALLRRVDAESVVGTVETPGVVRQFPARLRLADTAVLTQVVADSTPVAPTSSSFSISLWCTVATLTRPWLDTSWWANPGWHVPGYAPGSWSAGDLTVADQLIAGLPVALVAVKDVTITASWSGQDAAQLASPPPSLGPFALASATFSGGTLSVPGVQVVGWTCKVPPVLPPPEAPAPASGRVLREGDSGDDVRALQARLVALGRAVPVDGAFGAATTDAVRAVQAERGLEVDGLVGPLTWAALQGAP